MNFLVAGIKCYFRPIAEISQNESRLEFSRIDPIIGPLQCRRDEIHIAGVAHCIPSHSIRCYKGNILMFEIFLGGGVARRPALCAAAFLRSDFRTASSALIFYGRFWMGANSRRAVLKQRMFMIII